MSAQKITAGQRINLSLVSWGRLGEAMAYHNGQEVFVLGGIPGERVAAEVIRVRRKYVAAQVVQVLEPSPDRVKPPCNYYGQCTGCQWQHLDYPAQLAVKQGKVVDALRRVGGFENVPVRPILPSPRQYEYRNHARFTVSREGALGFVNRETRRFVRVDRCMLMHDGINQLLDQLQDGCGETTQLAIRAGRETGDFLVQPALKNPAITLATGQKRYLESVSGRQFRVASPSFFQVNIEQTGELLRVVREALNLKGDETLLDAYTGVGTFAILLAPWVKRVYAIEESTAAVADARENAAGLDNVEFLTGKAETVLAALPEPPDVVILDPPRAGCQPAALRNLIEMGPPRVVYVSCDPETLARDLKILGNGPYAIERIQPLDMFPQTHHVECVALLTRELPGTMPERMPGTMTEKTAKLILASASPRRRELLTELGLDFSVIPSEAPEEPEAGESPAEMVQRLSRDKARIVAARRFPRLSRSYVVGADSTVVLEGRAIGKPADAAEARAMLRELRGTEHQVTTGLTVMNVASGHSLTDYMTADVVMRDFSDAEMEASIASGAPMDKAGAYAIQDEEFRPARLKSGCYTNVVGLPLCRLVVMLRELGYPLPSDLPRTVGDNCLTDCPFRPNDAASCDRIRTREGDSPASPGPGGAL